MTICSSHAEEDIPHHRLVISLYTPEAIVEGGAPNREPLFCYAALGPRRAVLYRAALACRSLCGGCSLRALRRSYGVGVPLLDGRYVGEVPRPVAFSLFFAVFNSHLVVPTGRTLETLLYHGVALHQGKSRRFVLRFFKERKFRQFVAWFPGVEARVVGARLRLNTPSAAVSATAKGANK